MHRHRRLVACAFAIASLMGAACGGGPRSTNADLVTIKQPTPDPTLDAVVRDLPHALAGVVAPTPTPTAAVIATPKPALKAPPTPTPKPAPRQPIPTPTPARR